MEQQDNEIVVVGGNEEPAVEAQGQVEASAPEVETIQIGDKTFTDHSEAIAYAKQLQERVAVHDAYQQGINDALLNQPQVQNVTQPAAEPEPLFDESEFYENPQAVIQKVMQRAKDEAVSTVRRETEQKERERKLWDDFYSKYPKLRRSDKLVKQVLQDNWSVLGHMPDAAKAMDILAQKATDQINNMLSDFIPSQVLPQTKQATSPGSQTNVTRPIPEEPALDFIAQAKQQYKL